MSKRTKQWARTARLHLLAEFGNKCQHCRRNTDLEFHVIGGEQSHHQMSTDARVSFYRRMASANRLKLLCPHCHIAEHLK